MNASFTRQDFNFKLNLIKATTVTSIIIVLISQQIYASDDNAHELLELTTTEMIRSRGYLAEDHYFLTSDGFVINMIKAINPTIKDKRVVRRKSAVLLLHGITTSAKCFMMFSAGATPRDLSNLSANLIEKKDLAKLLADDDSAKSILLLLLNFGHEVWLMNRRSVLDSMRQTINLAGSLKTNEHLINDDVEVQDTIIRKLAKKKKQKKGKSFIPKAIEKFKDLILEHNYKFWNFSFDEQAEIDLPEAVDFVLKKSNRERITILGHSAGGQLILQALAINPNLIDKC